MPTVVKISKKKVFMFAGLAFILLLAALSSYIWETNEAGQYQVKQAFYSGELTVRNTPGTYGQLFGTIHTYNITGDVFLSKDGEDGGSSEETQSERVLFPNGYADVNFVGLYEVPLDAEVQKEIHIKYNSDDNLNYMVKQQIIEALKNTGTLMSAEEAYSNGRAEFIRLAREQALYGLYKSHVTLDTVMISGQEQINKRYGVALDKDGNPIITKKSILSRFGITLPQFNIKDMDFDSKLVALIEARKDAQKSEQDAITAKARGEAQIATKKAEQEALKIEAVTMKEKEKAVAILEAEKKYETEKLAAATAEQEKKKKIFVAQGIAEELRIADGLSEREKYQIDADVKRDIGVAEHLAKWVGPEIVIAGGKDGNGGAGVDQALMIQMLREMVNKKK